MHNLGSTYIPHQLLKHFMSDEGLTAQHCMPQISSRFFCKFLTVHELRLAKTSQCSMKPFRQGSGQCPGLEVVVPIGFPAGRKTSYSAVQHGSPASRVIIRSTWSTRFPPRTPNYNLASNLYCRKESNERVIIPKYINTHIWHVNNSHVCFPNSNPLRHISAVGMDRVFHDRQRRCSSELRFLLNFPTLTVSPVSI